jgi:diguanylate cyclase (GGDEF)-like protein
MKSLLGRIPVLGFGLGLGIFLVAILISALATQGVDNAMQELRHSQSETQAMHSLSESLRSAQSNFRGYLLSDNLEMLQDYPMQVAAMRAALERLRGLARADEGLAGKLAPLSAQVEAYLAFMNKALALHQTGAHARAAAMVGSGEGTRLLTQTETVFRPLLTVQEQRTEAARGVVELSTMRLAWVLRLSLLSTVIVMLAAAGGALRENKRLHRAENGLRESESRLFQFLDALPVGVFVTEAEGTPYFANKSGEKILGRGLYREVRPDEFSRAYDLVRAPGQEPYPPGELPIAKAMQGVSAECTDLEVRRPDGRVVPLQVWGAPVFDAAARVRYAMVAFADMTERQALLAKLEGLSRYDGATGFYNRRAFLEQAQMQLRQAMRERIKRVLFFIDMDNLKWINDHLGHAEGDNAIHEITRILRLGFRDTDLIGRLGGDEFVVLAQPGAQDHGDPVRIFRERLERLNQQSGRRYRLDFSYGSVIFDPADPVSLEELIAAADTRMYEDKRAKKAAEGGSEAAAA